MFKRYEVPYSSIFTVIDYDLQGFKRIAHSMGLKNIRDAYHVGLNNQPRVITFTATEEQAKEYQSKLMSKYQSEWIRVQERRVS